MLSESQKKTLVLLDIQERLHSWDRNLKQIGIKEPTQQELEAVKFSVRLELPILFKEELDFNISQLKDLVNDRKLKFNEDQTHVYETIIKSVEKGEAAAVFVDARGGTGKTFVLNAILAAIRTIDNGSIALAVGATGIAANLLHLGRTFHSRFKVPLNMNCESVCNINAGSPLAKLICEAKIIVWDEAPMAHRFQLEALDRTLRDLTNVDKPFGGKVMLLSGDFRQCLPVIPGASRAEVVDAALNRSYLWPNFKVMKLNENMRVKMTKDPEAETFDQFTLSLGNGETEVCEGIDMVEIPKDMCLNIDPNSPENPGAEKVSMSNLMNHVYPNIKSNFGKSGWLDGRAIL